MARVLIGSILGGIALWIIGYVFWGTPLNRIALATLDDATGASLQSALRQSLGPLGTGAYPVPWPGTQVGSQLYAQGPSAMIFFQPAGLPVVDSAALIGGLVLAVICALLVGATLYGLRDRVATFGERMKLVVGFALAATLWTDIGQPVFNHMPWGYFTYLWISDLLGLVAAGAVIARWFLPTGIGARTERTSEQL